MKEPQTLQFLKDKSFEELEIISNTTKDGQQKVDAFTGSNYQIDDNFTTDFFENIFLDDVPPTLVSNWDDIISGEISLESLGIDLDSREEIFIRQAIELFRNPNAASLYKEKRSINNKITGLIKVLRELGQFDEIVQAFSKYQKTLESEWQLITDEIDNNGGKISYQIFLDIHDANLKSNSLPNFGGNLQLQQLFQFVDNKKGFDFSQEPIKSMLIKRIKSWETDAIFIGDSKEQTLECTRVKEKEEVETDFEKATGQSLDEILGRDWWQQLNNNGPKLREYVTTLKQVGIDDLYIDAFVELFTGIVVEGKYDQFYRIHSEFDRVVRKLVSLDKKRVDEGNVDKLLQLEQQVDLVMSGLQELRNSMAEIVQDLVKVDNSINYLTMVKIVTLREAFKKLAKG